MHRVRRQTSEHLVNIFKQPSRSIAVQQRYLSNTRKAMVNFSDISVSSGEDAEAVAQQASSLVDNGKWRICNGGKGLERPFKFKTFKATWDFMNTVAEECKKTRHHPEWSNVYNKTHIRWTTHSPEGLSSKDTHMAQFCDEAAKSFNELQVQEGGGNVGGDGKIQAGDCCMPSK